MSLKKIGKDLSILDLIAAIIYWGLTAGWIIFIFKLSSENGTDSSLRSSALLETIELLFGRGVFNDLLIRKIAHITEFAILTFLSFMAVRYTNRISVAGSYAESPVKIIKSDNEMYIVISLWLSLLTAVVDEYHQLFVDGRDGSIVDVLIDCIGIVIVLVIIRVVFSIYLKRLGKQEIRYDEIS